VELRGVIRGSCLRSPTDAPESIIEPQNDRRPGMNFQGVVDFYRSTFMRRSEFGSMAISRRQPR
jgi:hypothetical protein